ncbi:MAG: transglycosylase SLT domain-containing protein [Gemmatimonadota bacterium]|nr:transglycosylase SLT domain-containing protein [Gemmatimonadota bacterium]
MTDKAKWAWTMLSLSLLVLLPVVYFYFSAPAPTEPPLEPPPEVLTPEPLSPIAVLIAEDRCDLAYPQLTALDTIQHDPTAQAHREFQRAFCERMLKEPDRAYDRLRDLYLPALDDYRRFWIARSLEDMGQTHDAIAEYKNFLATSTNPLLRNPASMHLASLYRTAGQPAKALALYKEQLSQGTDPARVLYLLATTSQKHDSARAQKWRLELLENHPGSKHARNSLSHLPKKLDARTAYAKAHTHYSHKRYNQAIKSFRNFIRQHSGDQRVAQAHYMLGRAHQSAGHYTKAEQVFRTVHERYGSPAALYRIASLSVRRDREDKAISAYANFAKRYPQHDLADDALWQAAKAAERKSQFARAATLYGRLAEHYPQTDYGDEARWSVGFALYCQEQYSEALAAFERAGQQAHQPHIIDQSLYWAGKSAERLGQTQDATAFYRRAAAGFPRSYYSARAVLLGHKEQVQLKKRPTDNPRQDDVPALAHRAHLERAGLLNQLGLRDWSAAEMEQAVLDYKGHKAALKAIRDYYEALGYRDQAMRLSLRLFDGQDPEELSRIYPTYYWEEIAAAAAEAQIDPYLVLSVIRQESTFNEKAISRAGARGLMQIMPHTGLNLARRLKVKPFELRTLFDPAVSIRFGSYFLGDQMRRFTTDAGADLGFELGLAAYNAGPHNARRWLKTFPTADPDAFVERIPFKETRLYVKLVLRNYAIYKALSDDA